MSVVPYDPNVRAVMRVGSTFNADWLLDPAEIANRIGGTDFVPRSLRGNAAAITAAILYGAEVGLGIMQSLAKIAVIEGRPTLAAEAQRALILADGHDLWIEESSSTRCTVAGRRRGSEMVSRVTWTLDDAKRARIAGKPNWQGYPRQMLLARASAELARMIFADVIGGLAATEELEDFVDDSPMPSPAGELTKAPEGAEPAKPPARRRRRVGTTASSSSSAPTTPEPEPTREPAEPTPIPPEPEPAPDPEPEVPANEGEKPEEPATPDAPNRQQMGLLFALFTEKGLGERDDRLRFSERALGRSIKSAKELSALDVSRLIEALKSEATPPPAEPAALPENEQALLDDLADTFDARETGG